MFYVSEFLDHLKNSRYSPKTIREYGYVLKYLQDHFDRVGVDDVKNISESRMHEYLKELEKEKEAIDEKIKARIVLLKLSMTEEIVDTRTGEILQDACKIDPSKGGLSVSCSLL